MQEGSERSQLRISGAIFEKTFLGSNGWRKEGGQKSCKALSTLYLGFSMPRSFRIFVSEVPPCGAIGLCTQDIV